MAAGLLELAARFRRGTLTEFNLANRVLTPRQTKIHWCRKFRSVTYRSGKGKGICAPNYFLHERRQRRLSGVIAHLSNSRWRCVAVVVALFVLQGDRLPSSFGRAAHSCPATVRVESAVVDRLVDGGRAVLLVGPDQSEWIIERSRLPTGWSEGSWLLVPFDANLPEQVLTDRDCEGGPAIVLDHETSNKARARVLAKLEWLRQRIDVSR